MAGEKVVGFAGKKASRDSERHFLAMLDNDTKANPDHVRPLPHALFERFDAIEKQAAKIQAEELMEG